MIRNEVFAERLAEAIDECGLDRDTIRSRAGIANSTLSGYLHGRREPTANRLPQLAAAVGVTPDWLVGRDGARKHAKAFSAPRSETKSNGPKEV